MPKATRAIWLSDRNYHRTRQLRETLSKKDILTMDEVQNILLDSYNTLQLLEEES